MFRSTPSTHSALTLATTAASMPLRSILNVTVRTVIAASLSAGAAIAVASNSDATGGNTTSDAQAYNTGKGVYAQKLNCKTCPLVGKSLDVSMARELLAGKGTPALSEQEQQALNVYLDRKSVV